MSGNIEKPENFDFRLKMFPEWSSTKQEKSALHLTHFIPNHKIICSLNSSLRPCLISPLLDEIGNADVHWAQALAGKTKPVHENQWLNTHIQVESGCDWNHSKQHWLKNINTWWLSYMVKTINTQTLQFRERSQKIEAKIMTIRVIYPFNSYFLSATKCQAFVLASRDSAVNNTDQVLPLMELMLH